MQLPDELYRNYHNRRKSDLERLKAALQENNVEPFRVLGHQLKGNAPTYGYDDLAKLGEEMEALSPEDFRTRAPMVLAAFETWIQDTESRLPV